MGADNVYTVGGGTGPSISVTSSETTTPSNLSWSNACSGGNTVSCTSSSSTSEITWTNTDSTWTGTYNSSSDIKYLILRFNSTDTSYVYLDTNSSVANVYASGNKASAITADFENTSLGTSDKTTKLELYLSGTDAKKITVKNLNVLNGGLNVGGPTSASTGITENQYTYDVTVNTINGDLTTFGSNYYLQGTVTINNALNGSIYVSRDSTATISNKNSSTAGLTVKFVDGAAMTGDILDRVNGFGGIRKDIYFAGSGTVLTGSIVSFGTGSSASDYLNTYAGNRVYFTQGSMTGYIIASTGNDVTRKGLNVVIFGDTANATTQTLTGGILASDIRSTYPYDTNAQQATNIIVLADNTTLDIKGNSDNSSEDLSGSFANGALVGGDIRSSSSSKTYKVTSGSIVARNYGVNEIRIYKGSTLNLNDGQGSIQSVVNDISGTTISNGSALNKINFLSEGGVINGSIVADNSGNSGTSNKASALIYVANNASGTITGNLTTMSSTSGSVSGRMLVILGSSNTTSVAGVNTTYATSTSSTNTSTLTLQGSSNTITGLTTTGVKSDGTTTTSGDAVNTASLILDSSNSGESGQSTTISGTVSNKASALNKHSNQNP